MAARPATPRAVEELRIALRELGLSNGPLIPAYTLTAIDLKGQGLCAGCYIPRGTLIFDEAPLFSITNCEDPLTPANQNQIQQEAAQHPEFRGLHCSRPRQGLPQRPTALPRFELNNIEMNGQERRRGIFMNAARLNHSCVPNAHFEYYEFLGRLTVYAIHNIEQGDEILVSYMSRDWHKTTHDRKTDLRRNYGFGCLCQPCKGGAGFGWVRQHGRLKVHKLWGKILAHRQRARSSPQQGFQYLQHLSALADILALEGLVYPALAEVYELMAEYCSEELSLPQELAGVHHEVCRDRGQNAARYKLRLAVMCTGQNSQIVADILTWMEGLGF